VLDRLKCLATLAHRLQLRIGDRLRIKSRRSVVAISILALSCGGCSNSDFVYLNQGIGTALSASDLETQSSLLNQYVDLLCQQAGLVPEGILVPCNDAFFSPAQWMIFVQAGMNDIDRRCDAYLQWLDDKRRWQHPILQEISDVRTATELIMAASGVGVAPIAIVGAAFGLATSTFTNLSSRLVLEVNQSTVQSVVLTSQNKYRFTLINGDPLTVPPTPPTVIVSRPSAIYVLRSYLRLCLPFTIETQINTTVTAVDRGDTEATYRKPLITPAAAGVPFTARSVIVRPSREAPPAATSPLIKYSFIVKSCGRF
jgi:hypothetical protein